jgi:peroxiredoxin family protein
MKILSILFIVTSFAFAGDKEVVLYSASWGTKVFKTSRRLKETIQAAVYGAGIPINKIKFVRRSSTQTYSDLENCRIHLVSDTEGYAQDNRRYSLVSVNFVEKLSEAEAVFLYVDDYSDMDPDRGCDRALGL